MVKNILQNLGLTNNEIDLYLKLLELGSASASELSEHTEVHRKNTYDSMRRLIRRGIVTSVIAEKKLVFKAIDPQSILDVIKRQEQEVKNVLPKLKILYKKIPRHQDATVYRGKEGMKAIFEDVLKNSKEYVKLGTEKRFMETLPLFFSQYQRRKLSNGVKCRAVFNEDCRFSDAVKEFAGSARFIDSRDKSPVTTIIYSGKVAIMVWIDEPFGTIIQSREVWKSYATQFNFLWNAAKK